MLMSKKSIILTALGLALGATATAEVSLVVNGPEETEVATVDLSTVRKVTFGAEGVNIVLNDESSQVVAWQNVQKLTFTGSEGGIKDASLTEDLTKVVLFCANECVGARGLNAGVNSLAVIDVCGRTVVSQPNWNGTPVSISHLPKGVYILKVNNQTLKFKR